MRKPYQIILLMLLVCFVPAVARAQSFRVQCPTSTITHPDPTNSGVNNSEPTYNGPTQFTTNKDGYVSPTAGTVNGAIKCQQISGGHGCMTEADGTQTFMFSFGPLSGLADVAAGKPSTQFPSVFNTPYPGTLTRGHPATTDGATSGASPGVGVTTGTVVPPFSWNGAVGLAPDIPNIVTMTDIVEGVPPLAENRTPPPATLPVGADYCSTNPTDPGYPGTTAAPNAHRVTVYMNASLGLKVGDKVVIANDAHTFGETGSATPSGYLGTQTVTCVNNNGKDPAGRNSFIITYNDPIAGLAANTGNFNAGTASVIGAIDGHVDPRPIMDVGVMNGNIPAPLMAFDEDDEFFLTLSNVGMIMRPDLFEQHTVHFHGYPNASAFYDGVPDASVAINIGGSFTYYYLAPDAGTYFWHCHITPPEHLQMGMVGQLYVRPRQNRAASGAVLYNVSALQQGDLRTACYSNGASNLYGGTAGTAPSADILCSVPPPATNNGATHTTGNLYVYNDGDGTTRYDIDVPIQIHGFDPNFHFVGMTFNSEGFSDMKDKYFLLNGRSYPDTISTGAQLTAASDANQRPSQPMPTLITLSRSGALCGPGQTPPTGQTTCGQRAALRIADLDVSEYQTLASLGIPMQVVGYNAKLLRDQAGNNLYYNTNSITLAGGESLDVILDASNTTLYPSGSVYYLYTPNLDHLSNDAENFGGLMTEVRIN